MPDGKEPIEPSAAPRILYVVTEDWYFLSHRLPMARAARAAGFEVHVATRVADGGPAIAAEGFVLHPVPFARGSLSLSASLATVSALRRLLRRLQPVIVHHVAIQPVVLGSLAAIGLPVARVNAITGFGYAFTSATLRARLIRRAILAVIRTLLNRPDAVTLVQNDDDRATLIATGFPAARIAMIPGSGVDIAEFAALPEPAGTPTVGYVGRLLRYKGVSALVEAQVLLRARGVNVDLLIAGTPDLTNPDSHTTEEVNAWATKPGISCLGHINDITTVWRSAHIAALPSQHEGVPKSLLEAAACGRPMVATDVPGCRDIVRPRETGILVPLGEVPALAAAIETLAGAPELRAAYGAAARRLAAERFSADAVGRQTVELYRRLTHRTPMP
jgi:glycosyltransferase involved in cell wall biosynthesis